MLQKVGLPALADGALLKTDSFIDGAWVPAASGARFVVHNPADGLKLAVNVGAMLIAFLALIAGLNALLDFGAGRQVEGLEVPLEDRGAGWQRVENGVRCAVGGKRDVEPADLRHTHRAHRGAGRAKAVARQHVAQNLGGGVLDGL